MKPGAWSIKKPNLKATPYNNVSEFLQIMQSQPSLTLQRLKKYHKSLQKIIDSKLEISFTDEQEVLRTLAFEDESFEDKSTAHLEEDLKNK